MIQSQPMQELGGNMYRLENSERLIDAFDPSMVIAAPQIVRQEELEIDKEKYLRFQGTNFIVSVRADTIQEAIAKSASQG